MAPKLNAPQMKKLSRAPVRLAMSLAAILITGAFLVSSFLPLPPSNM
jgi:hypothetical protein